MKYDFAGFQVSEAIVKLDVITGNSKSMGVGTLYRYIIENMSCFVQSLYVKLRYEIEE